VNFIGSLDLSSGRLIRILAELFIIGFLITL
jgi:hypothetical protein